MSGVKIETIAKKLNLTVDDALEKLKGAGIEVENATDTINDEGIKLLGGDPKDFLDRRQEMLKKVLDRRKHSKKPKEVFIKKDNPERTQRKRLTKEEILKKRQELDNKMKQIDKNRKNKPKAEETEKVEKTNAKENLTQTDNKKQIIEDAKKAVKTAEEKTNNEKIRKDIEKEKSVSKPKKEHSNKTDKKDTQAKPIKKETKVIETPTIDKSEKIKPTKEVSKSKTTKPEVAEIKKVKTKKAPKPVSNIKKVLEEGIDELEMEKAIESGELVDTFEEKIDVEIEEKQETKEKAPAKVNKPAPKYHKKKGKKSKGKKEPQEKVIIRPEKIEIGENVLVGDFAHAMGIKATEIVMKLMELGIMANVTQSIDFETAEMIADEYGIKAHLKTITEEDFLPDYKDMPAETAPRPPIVTVMGHVDHGKTSLLDKIRKTSVADGEAGGITQHIGAYEVELENGTITFLDTPGHEAFTTLRARGANVTDIVILVVAADDGVMPQTVEAINHAKAAGVKLVVAINKIDKENANPEVVKSKLAEYDVVPEEWGGEYQFQEISAKNNLYIDELLEKVLLEAELLELKGNPNRPAEGIVIESRLDKQKGAVATILVSNGTLKKGDNFVVGSAYGKVRAMFNYKGRSVKEAGPSCPVEIMGFNGTPESGERFIVVENEKIAKQVAELRLNKKKEAESLDKGAVTLEDLFGQIKEGELVDLNIIIKADVQGSAEALKTSLEKLSNSEVKVKIIHTGTGGINESDVLLATTSKAVIIGFNVRPDNKAKQIADREGVEIKLYSVIYEAIDDVKKAIEGMLTPEIKEEVIGKVEVREVFSVPKIGKIAGCYVLEGKVERNAKVRVIRDNVVIYDGEIGSLKRFKEDVKEVKSGYECGMSIDKYNDIKEGDIFEVYKMVEEKRTLKDVE
jgi:translation initiation factor IF-2